MKQINSAITILLISISFFLGAATARAQNVTVTITGLKADKGQILISVFNSEQGFEDEKAVSTTPFTKTKTVNGVLTVSLTLKPGTYGLTIIDDENGNKKLDKNMIGIPKEGIGFSNFYLSGMSKPKLSEFQFEVKTAPVTVQSKLRYF